MADEKKLEKGYLDVEGLGFIAHEYITADELKEAELAAASAISFKVETGVDAKGEPVREAIGEGGLEMAKDDSAKVIAVLAPFISKCPKFVWESSDPEVVCVSDQTFEITDDALIELVHALKDGKATITITSIPEKESDVIISASFDVAVGEVEEEGQNDVPAQPTVSDPEEPANGGETPAADPEAVEGAE